MREQEERTAYGSFLNVFLSGEDYKKLHTDFPECDEYIERLSRYMVLCQDNGHIKPLFFSKISKMHKLVAFIPRFA